METQQHMPSFKALQPAIADNDTTYTGRDGSKSVATCTLKVDIGNGIMVDATVYGRLDGQGNLTFNASVPRRGLTFASKSVKDTLIAIAESAVANWDGWTASRDRARFILTQPVKVNDGLNKPGSKPGSILGSYVVKPGEPVIGTGTTEAEMHGESAEAVSDLAPDAPETA